MKANQENRGYFGSTTHRFFFEYRCGTPCEGDLCSRCLTLQSTSWKDRGAKKRDPYREYYGLVTDPIPEPFFESDWFESKVTQVGQPSEADMVKAKKAQEIAKTNLVVPVSTSIPKVQIQTQTQTQTQTKSKRGRNSKQPQTPIPLPVPPCPPTPDPDPAPAPAPAPNPNPPPKPAGKRRSKAKVPVSVEISRPSIDTIQAIEVNPPLQEIEILKIVVRPFYHKDTRYFRDVTKNKLYSVGKDLRPSIYVGRWNPETETIHTDVPDSDME